MSERWHVIKTRRHCGGVVTGLQGGLFWRLVGNGFSVEGLPVRRREGKRLTLIEFGIDSQPTPYAIFNLFDFLNGH